MMDQRRLSALASDYMGKLLGIASARVRVIDLCYTYIASALAWVHDNPCGCYATLYTAYYLSKPLYFGIGAGMALDFRQLLCHILYLLILYILTNEMCVKVLISWMSQILFDCALVYSIYLQHALLYLK